MGGEDGAYATVATFGARAAAGAGGERERERECEARVLRNARPSTSRALFGAAAQDHLPAAYAVARGFCSREEVDQLNAWFADGGGGGSAGVSRTTFDGEELQPGDEYDPGQPAVAQLFSKPAPLAKRFPWLLERVQSLKDGFGGAIGVDAEELELVTHAQDVRHITYSDGHECPWHLDNPTSSFNTIVMCAQHGEDFDGGVLSMGPNDEPTPLSLDRGDAVIYSTPRTEHAVSKITRGVRKICLVELKRRDLVEGGTLDGPDGANDGAEAHADAEAEGDDAIRRCAEEEERRKLRKPLELPAAAARSLLEERWGVSSPEVLRELVSYDDRNYAVRDASGGARYVLKVHNGVESDNAPLLEAMNSMMLAVAGAGVPCPTPVVCTGGEHAGAFTALGVSIGGAGGEGESEGGGSGGGSSHIGGRHAVRLLHWVEGKTLVEDLEQTEALWVDCGRLIGTVARALGEMEPIPPALRREHLWDLARFAAVGGFVGCIADESRSALAARALREFAEVVSPVSERLPKQALHNDLNEQNILVADGAAAGVVDFGDAVYSWRVAEIAIALAYQALNKVDPVEACAAMMRGYAMTAAGLDEVEMRVLPTLVRARLACSVVMGAYSHSLDPKNDYLLVTQEPGWKVLSQLMLEDGERAHFEARMGEAYDQGRRDAGRA